MTSEIAVLGGGSWGTTLAAHLAKKGKAVTLWEFDKGAAAKLKAGRKLATLPQLHLPDSVDVTDDIGLALKNKKIIVSAVPSHTVRSTFKAAAASKALAPGATVV